MVRRRLRNEERTCMEERGLTCVGIFNPPHKRLAVCIESAQASPHRSPPKYTSTHTHVQQEHLACYFFGACCTLLFLCSALYHRVRWSPRWEVCRCHTMIYTFIYTCACVLYMQSYIHRALHIHASNHSLFIKNALTQETHIHIHIHTHTHAHTHTSTGVDAEAGSLLHLSHGDGCVSPP